MRWRSALGIAVLAAIVAAAILVVPEGGGGAPPATPTRLASAAAWNGLVGGARAEVGDRAARPRGADRLLPCRPRAARRWPRNRCGGTALDRGCRGRAAAVHLGRRPRGRRDQARVPLHPHPERVLGRSRPTCHRPDRAHRGSEGRLSGTRRVPCIALAASAPPGRQRRPRGRASVWRGSPAAAC